MSNRRSFLKHAASGGALLSLLPGTIHPSQVSSVHPPRPAPIPHADATMTLDLSPAEWLWYPSWRTLPNTVVLFRRNIVITSPVTHATGWIAADSRYLLTIDGQRVQWGPAPSDPRRMEIDPISVTAFLAPGTHTIGVTVLYYGHGDGTHPIGKPGFIFSLDVQCTDGSKQSIASDRQWLCHLSRAWKPGQYKRWYVRSFQEIFDARRHPRGWELPAFSPDSDWLPPLTLQCPANLPPSCSTHPDDLLDTRADRTISALVPRSIPMLDEHPVLVRQLSEAHAITWLRPADEYFDVLAPDAFQTSATDVRAPEPNRWDFDLDGISSVALTFELDEQIVGFPFFSIEAPPGTIIEVMVQEGHTIGGPPLLNTHFHSWARFICAGGGETFQTFDFESCRWLQIHCRGTRGPVSIRNVGVLRRVFPWPVTPVVRVNEPALQRLMDASVNTLLNSAQETAVDGMGRERQQYSGDGSHQLHAVYLAFGERRLPARFLSTFSQGLMLDGYFFDCWPAYDRLARTMERQIDMTIWGPLLDHSIGFGFDCYHHYLYTGDLVAVREPWTRYQRFVDYLHRIRAGDGLLPVTGLGLPNVWMDHYAYARGHQEHKQCAFNLYAAAMLRHAFAPLARAYGESRWAEFAEQMSDDIHHAAVRAFWSDDEGRFIINLPWLGEQKQPRLCDRSTATALLFDFCPEGRTGPSLESLADPPPQMGLSYPANACWRYWALARGGRTDVILNEFRNRWARMDSVILNNTIAEVWDAKPDSSDLWSHCAVVPLYLLFMGVAGITPTAPGFARCRIRPQPADLTTVTLAVPTPRGELFFQTEGEKGNRQLTVRIPAGCEADLDVDARENVNLPPTSLPGHPARLLFRLPAGRETTLVLNYT